MLNLDTNILLFAIDEQLSREEDALLRSDSWSISSIVLWELAKLRQHDKISLRLTDPALNYLLGRITIWPISVEVCLQLNRLDFSSDPADELIAATSLAFDVPLLTRDMRMLGSKVVPLARR